MLKNGYGQYLMGL